MEQTVSSSGGFESTQESRREPKNGSDVSPGSKGGDVKVIEFLSQLRGHDVLQAGGNELDLLLYESRFELLPQQQSAVARLNEARGPRLPPYSLIPTHEELHAALTGGNLAQCVAHALYPESVAWPFGTGTDSPQADDENSPEQRDDDTGAADSQSAVLKAGATAESAPVVEEAKCCDVTVCGQKITTTVRGRLVMEANEDSNEVADDAKYKAAKEKRQQLERAVRLEEYRERELVAMITSLEAMREAEISAHEDILKRERARIRRKEALKGQLKRDAERKTGEERLAQERAADEQKRDTEAKERAQRYYDKQKRVVDEWYVNRPDDACSAEKRQRRRDDLEQKRLGRCKDVDKARTVRQKEVQEQVRRIHEATECRPPMPPRPHDLPAPVLSPEVSRSSSPSTKALRLHPERALTIDATTVLHSYGLSRDKVERKRQHSQHLHKATLSSQRPEAEGR